MQSWSSPSVPEVPGEGEIPRLHDTATGELRPARGVAGRAGLYVCGITPYDSTHLGHAATYLAFDTLVRVWKDAGLFVGYVQNVTDIDDPLLERAEQTGVDWAQLAQTEIERFRGDMTALQIIPPDSYVGVVESIPEIAEAVARMLSTGAAYTVGEDVYADLSIDRFIGEVSGCSEAEMATLFAERGGDPDTPGKRDPLDPLLWRGRRDGEPAWPGGDLGPGRPGWHIECAVIARAHLRGPFTVQGGGSDLIYPHHEMSTSHLREITGTDEPIALFVHTGLVGYRGHKMSKSRGNLVFVSRLLADGVPPQVLRLALLAHHYRQDWEYSSADLFSASQRWLRWSEAASLTTEEDAAGDIAELRAALAHDLDTPSALEVVDAWAGGRRRPGGMVAAVHALLGVDLRPAEQARIR